MANRYLVGTGARNLGDSANWSETSGGAGGASVPTSADAVFLDANSGTGTVTINADFNCASFDASALGAATTITGSVYLFNCYGSFTGNSFLTFTLTGTSYFYSRGTGTITQGGATLKWNRWYIDAAVGTVTHGDDFTALSVVGWVSSGTLNTNNKNISINRYYVIGTATVNLGASILTLIGWQLTTGTLNSGTSLIKIVGSGNFFGGGQTYYDIEYTNVSYPAIGSQTTARNVTVNSGLNITSSQFRIDANLTVTGILTIVGANDTNYRCIVYSNTIGTPRTITVNGSIVASNVDFRDIVIAGTAAPFDASAITGGSGDCGGNSNIIFTPAQTQYYKHSGTSEAVWSDSQKWFSDEALTIPASMPLPQDKARFIEGSFDADCTLRIDVTRICGVDMLRVNRNIVFKHASNAINIYGGLQWNKFVTNNSSYVKDFWGRGLTHYLESKNNIGNGNCRFGTFLLTGDFKAGGLGAYSNAIVDFNGFNVELFGTLGASGNLIYGKIFLRNGITTINVSTQVGIYRIEYGGNIIDASEATIIFKTSGSTSKELVNSIGSAMIFNKVIVGGTGTASYPINANNSFNDLIVEPGFKLFIEGGKTQIIRKLTAIGTPEAPITITSTTTTPFNLVKSGAGKVQADYLNLSYSNATPANKWYAGANSVDGGNNTGWIFGVFTPILLGAFTEIETMIADGLAEALIQANFTEVEEAECEVIGEALSSFDFTETETLAVEVVADAVLQVAFTEEETMEALLTADALIEVAFTEKEWIGGENGSEGLRAYEKICGVSDFQTVISGDSDFQTVISGDSDIMNNDDCN